MSKLIAIEGNISCGKSSLLNKIKSQFGITVLCEPVSLWNSYEFKNKNFNFLHKFYKEANFGFEFQTFVLATLSQAIKNNIGNSGTLITEWSLGSSLDVFTEILHKEGRISDEQRAILYSLGQSFKTCSPELFTYECLIVLDADPSVCQSRAEQRGRPEESRIELKYYNKISDAYKVWLANECRPLHVKNVHFVNANLSESTILSQVIEIIRKLY